MKLLKSIVLCFILFVTDHVASAEWVGIASSNERGGYVVYLDPSSKVALKEIVTFWLLYDFKLPQRTGGSSFSSYQIHLEVDCRKRLGRILGFLDFLDRMGDGDPVRVSSAAQDWVPLSPDGKDKTLWALACAG